MKSFINLRTLQVPSSDNDKECCQLKLTHEQTIAPNAKNIVIEDIGIREKVFDVQFQAIF